MAAINLLQNISSNPFDGAPNEIRLAIDNSNTGTNPFDDFESNFSDTEDIEKYLDTYKNLRDEISQIEKNSNKVHDAADDWKRAGNHDKKEHKEIMSSVEKLTKLTESKILAIKNELTEQKQDNDKFVSDHTGSSVAQYRINQINSLTKRFHFAVTEFQEGVTTFRETLRNSQKDQLHIIDEKLSDEDINTLTENPEQAAQVLQSYFSMQVSDEFLDHLSDLENQLEGMKKIEQSVLELQDMWKELQLLVSHQQEMLDNVTANVHQTRNYIEKGVKELISAEKSQKCARKQMCIIFCCLMVAVIVAIAIVLPSIGAFQSS